MGLKGFIDHNTNIDFGDEAYIRKTSILDVQITDSSFHNNVKLNGKEIGGEKIWTNISVNYTFSLTKLF